MDFNLSGTILYFVPRFFFDGGATIFLHSMYRLEQQSPPTQCSFADVNLQTRGHSIGLYGYAFELRQDNSIEVHSDPMRSPQRTGYAP